MNDNEFYCSQSPFTDPLEYSYLYDLLPDSPNDICDVVHNLVIHKDDTEKLYGFNLAENRKLESNTRYVSKILKRLMELDRIPLTKFREQQKRFVGSCRDFAILTCSIFRYKKIPSRLRCGFAGYFHPDWYSDHWVCEYLDGKDNLWKLADAELGVEEAKTYNIDFDKINISRDKFLVAGKAWLEARDGKMDPNVFGVNDIDIKGLWFIRANVLRDLVSLNKVELLPWDYTPYADRQFKDISELSETEIKVIDGISQVTSEGDFNLNKVIRIYSRNPDLTVKDKLKSYTRNGPIDVELELRNI